jgi:hypothetical protein
MESFMNKYALILLAILLVVSCNTIPYVPTNTPRPLPTSTPLPSPTATIAPTTTPVPLSEIQLESIIIQEGDLPAGFSEAQIRDEAPERFRELPEAQNTIYQQLEKNGDVWVEESRVRCLAQIFS